MLNGAYRFPAMESVVFGKPYTEAVTQEVDRPRRARSLSWRAELLPEPPISSTGCA